MEAEPVAWGGVGGGGGGGGGSRFLGVGALQVGCKEDGGTGMFPRRERRLRTSGVKESKFAGVGLSR